MLANPPYGQSQDLAFGNWKLWCKISIPGVTADGKYITGTNVLAECSVGMTTPSSGSPVYQFMQVKWVQLDVSGANANGTVNFSKDWTYSDHLFTPPAPELPQGPGGTQGLIEGNPPDFRFSSAKFTHLSEVTLTLTVKFKGWRDVNGVPVGTESDPISVTIKPKAYNFFLGWRTTKMADGSPWGSGQPMINAIQSAINNMFVGFANHGHQSVNGPLYAQLHWLKPEIVDALDLATAVGPNTHGHFVGLNDSVSYTLVPEGLVSWVDIQSALSARPHPELPPACNLVLLYACNTLSFLDPAAGFGTANSPSRATAGFSNIVWTHGKRVDPNSSGGYGEPFTLDQHVIQLRQRLVQGYSLVGSLESVQRRVMPGKFNYFANGLPDYDTFQAVPMIVSGASDGYSTLVHVYLTGSERQQLEVYPQWYYVIGAPAP